MCSKTVFLADLGKNGADAIVNRLEFEGMFLWLAEVNRAAVRLAKFWILESFAAEIERHQTTPFD